MIAPSSRRLLIVHRLDRALCDAFTVQLIAKAITVKAGTIVDATIIASASEAAELVAHCNA